MAAIIMGWSHSRRSSANGASSRRPCEEQGTPGRGGRTSFAAGPLDGVESDSGLLTMHRISIFRVADDAQRMGFDAVWRLVLCGLADARLA